MIVSATLLHPLTEIRLPTLAHTSALARLVVTTAFDVTANTAMPAAIQHRRCFGLMRRPAQVVESNDNVP